MPNFSYVQTDFRGGIWSIAAQGRMELPSYKTALNECLNSLPIETGAWTRRPGFRFIDVTKSGNTGRLLPFRFSREQAYQAELTPGWLRFVVGLTLLREEPTKPTVVNINNATPAKVKVSALPWADGDTVMFNITSDPPSSYTLFNRQFVIRNLNMAELSFTLEDPVTGQPVSGADIAWRYLGGGVDTVQKILEFHTPYIASDIPNLRIVQDSVDTVLFLCPGHPPYALVISGATQFTFEVADFQDGPYLDENELTTTLALSGLTGSVTVTASGTANINKGTGFLATDVGRHIWFQGGPAAWVNSIPYTIGAIVLGSDNNIYSSLTGDNLNNDPTVDLGTNWEISANVLSITWLQITGWTDSTHVTALVRGQDVASGTATIDWRLGAYSATTGYPTCGAFHEGRMCLAGAVPNRFDMSKNFKSLTFSPSEIDGTISDDNGVSGTLDNRDAELISGMLSIDTGLFITTLSSEWLVRASAMDDPISPTSVQARSPSNSGSASIEPLRMYGFPGFVQSRKRKLMTNRRHWSGIVENIDTSQYAANLMAPSIAETAWSPEPQMSFYCRMSDGKLIGAIHKISLIEEMFTGWHRHEHGMGRLFEALSGGPDFSGTSDSIFVITADPTNPTAPRWIETMMPTQIESDPDWKAWHTDASGTASYIRRMISANGDAFDGVRIYGMWHLNGQQVDPYLGGVDLGTFTVTLGSIDIPYTADFTLALVDQFTNGTDYGDWGLKLQWADAPVTTLPVNPLNSIAVLDSETTATFSGLSNLWDHDKELYYRVHASSTPSIRVLDALSGELIREAPTYASIFPDGGVDGIDVTGNGQCTALVGPETGSHENGSIITYVKRDLGFPERFVLGLIDNVTLQMYSSFNTKKSASDLYQPILLGTFPFQYVNPSTGDVAYNNFVFSSEQQNIPPSVKLYSLSTTGALGGEYGLWGEMASASNLEGMDFVLPFRGYERLGVTVFYSYSPIDETEGELFEEAASSVVYEWVVSGLGVSHEKLFNLPAATLDPTWTSGYGAFSATYIADDGTFLIVASEGSGTGSRARAAKVDRYGNIIWNTLLPGLTGAVVFPPSHSAGPWHNHRWGYIDSAGVIRNLNLDDGSLTTLAGAITGLNSLSSSFTTIGEYDEVGPSLIVYGDFNSASGVPSPAISYIGKYANAHHDITSANFIRVWLGTTFTQSQLQRVINAAYNFIPTNIGVAFKSRGQLLRPDAGQDAGAIMGPAFGKKRRNHWWSALFLRAFSFKIGTDFSRLLPISFRTSGGKPIQQPALFSGVATDTLTDEYSFEGQIAWEADRQFPCTVAAVGGYIATQDK